MVRALVRHPDVDIRDVDAVGNTVLHYASLNGDEQVMRVLMLNGASSLIHLLNKTSQTALHIAMEHNNERVVAILLEIGNRYFSEWPTRATLPMVVVKDKAGMSVWEVGAQNESTEALMTLMANTNIFFAYHELARSISPALCTIIVGRNGLLDRSKSMGVGGLNEVVFDFMSTCMMPFATPIICYRLLQETNIISNVSLREEAMEAFENVMTVILDECRSLRDAVTLFQLYPLEEDRISCQKHIIQTHMKRVINHRFFQLYVDARWLGASSLGVSQALVAGAASSGDQFGSFFILKLFSQNAVAGFAWQVTLVVVTFLYHYVLFLPFTIVLGPIPSTSPSMQKRITGAPSVHNAFTVLSTTSVYSDLVQTTFIKFTYALVSHLVYVGALVYHTSTMERFNEHVRLRRLRPIEDSHTERLLSWSGVMLLVWSVGFLLMDVESTMTMRSKRVKINTIWVWSMRVMYVSFWLSAILGFFSNALSSSLFAVSCLAAMTRLIFFAGSHKTLGPLLIVILEMCQRLVGFAIIFVVVILSYWTFDIWTSFAAGRTVDTINTNEMQRILVSLFGEINPSSRPLSIYLILGFLGVLLIAMMTDAHASVKAKALFEWQYLRAPLVMTVEMMPSAPVPLNSIHFIIKQSVNAFNACCMRSLERRRADQVSQSTSSSSSAAALMRAGRNNKVMQDCTTPKGHVASSVSVPGSRTDRDEAGRRMDAAPGCSRKATRTDEARVAATTGSLDSIIGDADALADEASPRSEEGVMMPPSSSSSSHHHHQHHRVLAPFRGSFTRSTLNDEDEAVKDGASSRRDMEAVELMRTLVKHRIESRQKRIQAQRMLGEAVGIQDRIMHALDSIKYAQDALMESIHKMEDDEAMPGKYHGMLRKRDSVAVGADSPLSGAGAGRSASER